MRYVIGGGEVSSVPVDQSDTAIRRLGLSRSVVCALGHTIVADPAPVPDTLPPMAKSRLDSLLAERGLFESRTRAAAAVMAGKVRLGGADGARASKPGQMVAPDVDVAVDPGDDYVSRGGVKLANALDALDLPVAGRRCLDVGASTGGFTDVLLRRGAAAVTALDVGAGELHPRLREDARVTVIERVNARTLEPAALPYRPDLVVADVSFISLRKVLPAVLACTAEAFDCLALVKPQFELGPKRVGKGGVVRAADDRRAALLAVAGWASAAGFAVRGFASSGLPGPAGNRETFIWIAPGGGAGALDDRGLARAVAKVEP
jgi:23S rRNA (cytidine1920-2'-O)/16S rRNA (cytidine1409-2'-O)-methyltransferase